MQYACAKDSRDNITFKKQDVSDKSSQQKIDVSLCFSLVFCLLKKLKKIKKNKKCLLGIEPATSSTVGRPVAYGLASAPFGRLRSSAHNLTMSKRNCCSERFYVEGLDGEKKKNSPGH